MKAYEEYKLSHKDGEPGSIDLERRMVNEMTAAQVWAFNAGKWKYPSEYLRELERYGNQISYRRRGIRP